MSNQKLSAKAGQLHALANGHVVLDHVIIRKQINGRIFDMHGVTAARTGVEDYISLRFESMVVTPRARPAGRTLFPPHPGRATTPSSKPNAAA